MNFSDRLLENIRTKKGKIPFELNHEGVIKNLIFLYHACVASERLLQEAGNEALKFSEHEFYKTLSAYYYSHLEEERGEIRILKEDLLFSGVDPIVPDALSIGMVGTQYYLLKHIDPACLLGYMAVQEADPTPIELVEKLEHLFGKESFRFLRMHAIKDLEHRKELIALIDEAPADFHGAIWFSANNTLGYLMQAATEFYGKIQHNG
jgi:hypothetical protein